jgi:hypothetical protein
MDPLRRRVGFQGGGMDAGATGGGFGMGVGGVGANPSGKGDTGLGGNKGGKKNGKKDGTKKDSTKKDRTKELKALDKIRFDKKTAFKTKKGFLKDKFGNIVRSKKQVDRFNKQKALTKFKRENPNLVEERQSLLDKAKKNKISNTELDRLGILNQQFQKNPTVGMGPIESARYQFTNQQFKDDLAKARKSFSEIPTPFNLAKRLATGIVGQFAPKTQVAEAQAVQAQQPNVYGLDALTQNVSDQFKNPSLNSFFDKSPTGKAMFDRLTKEMGMTEQQAIQRMGEMRMSGTQFNQGGRVQMGHGGMMPMSGMMMSQSPTVIMNVANSGIGGILDKFKQIRSEM